MEWRLRLIPPLSPVPPLLRLRSLSIGMYVLASLVPRKGQEGGGAGSPVPSPFRQGKGEWSASKQFRHTRQEGEAG